jgi:signal transduction histidine kinase
VNKQHSSSSSTGVAQTSLSQRAASELLRQVGFPDLCQSLEEGPAWSPDQLALLESLLTGLARLRQVELELRGRSRVLEILATGAGLKEVLVCLAEAVEELVPSMRCSVLVLDRETGRLHTGAAPSFPASYSLATDGFAIGPDRGSCGTAAFTGKRVIVEDVMTHPYWKEFRALAREAGFRACWSEPIFSSKGQVLGTFAMYYAEPRQPSESEILFIHTTAQLAGIAIERRQQEAEIQAHREHLEELVQLRTAGLRSLSAELFLAEEKERRRLAEDLHDGLNQLLSLARMRLSAWRSEHGEDKALNDLHDLLESANRAARSLTYQLSPAVLHEFGLRHALERMLEDMRQDYGLDVTLACTGEEAVLPERERVILFRAVRELLINVVKHSGMKTAELRLYWKGNQLELAIEDRGVGFDYSRTEHRGFGLFGTRERLEHIGGRMEVRTSPKSGTSVRLVVPLIH